LGQDQLLVQIDPVTNRLVATIGLPDTENARAVGSDNALWLLSDALDRRGIRAQLQGIRVQGVALAPVCLEEPSIDVPIDPANPNFAVIGAYARYPEISAVLRQGTLWFTNFTDGELVRIDLVDEPPRI
jgi:hypothetical protein